MNSGSIPRESGRAIATWVANLRLGTKPPGEASGRIGLALVAVGLVAVFSVLNASFFAIGNFITIGVNSTSILIAVLGTSALLIAGYVDLSIGSMMALIGIIVAKVAVVTQETMLAIATGLGLGFILGLINGILVRKLSISPLIVTLAMLALYGGLAYVVSSVAVYGFPPALLELGRGKIWAVQYTVIIAVAVFVVGSFILTRTVTGLRIYAIGGDPRAAELCGVPVAPTVVGLYAVNGLLIGLVAVLVAGRLGSITPNHRRWLRVGRLDRCNPRRRGFRWRRGPSARYRDRCGDHWHPECRPHLHGPAIVVAVCRCWLHAASRARGGSGCRRQTRGARPRRAAIVHRLQQGFTVWRFDPWPGQRGLCGRLAGSYRPCLLGHRREEVLRGADGA